MNRRVGNVEAASQSSEEELFIGNITTSGYTKTWNVEVDINNKVVVAQVDTGAEGNIMSKKKFEMLNLDKNVIRKTNTNLLTFSGEKLRVMGKCKLNCVFENKKISLDFYIVDMNCKTVIGLDSCTKLNLVCIKNINVVHGAKDRVINSSNVLLEQYKEVFNGLGCLKNKCRLVLKENVSPVVEPPRKIPFDLQTELKAELERMEMLGVIVHETEPTPWVNSIVLVRKANGSLRVCLDPRHLNKVIMRPHFPFSDIEEVKSRLSNAKYFSSLDANSGFWMIPLDEESSKLCIFNTPFGRYRFIRLPFGVNAAPEIFHAEMIRHFSHIPNVVIYIDDFLIYGVSKEEHDKYLKMVLEKAQEIGLKFNKEKSCVRVKELKYIGHIFNELGVRPDESKIEAIMKMPRPNCAKDLQRFLGMINYLGSFIKGLAIENEHLRQLLKKEVERHWEERHENEFVKLKLLISKAPVLAYFDSSKAIKLSVDASQSAVGAVIQQENKPIAYASATLTVCQRNYAQIEEELFAILFGCSRFHKFLFGREVLVETDHKPLIPLFEKPLYKVPTRLQRLMLKLQAYNLKVIYKPGKEMVIADTLSRAALSEESLPLLDHEIEIHCNPVSLSLPVSDAKVDHIRKETIADETLVKLIQHYREGWPEVKKKIDPLVMPYFKNKNEIHVINGIVFMNNRIVIPSSMRSEILSLIHEGHMGSKKCISLAKSLVYWPNLNSDIINLVDNCEICLKHRVSNAKEPLMPHEILPLPWQKIGIDLFEFQRKVYMLVVDYYSKYIEIALLNSGFSSKKLTTELKSIFARHGIPKILVSDNGPPFSSSEFNYFCKTWNIEHVLSSPYTPRSNGLAERSVQTIKRLLKKSLESNSDPYIALLNYRSTPNFTSYSPAELLMNRKLRTKIPTNFENLRPVRVDDQKVNMAFKNNAKKMKKYFNRTTKPLKEVKNGENVYYKKFPKSIWYPGVVMEKCSEPRSYLIQGENNQVYRRNRQHIMKLPSTPKNSNFEILFHQESSPSSDSSALSPERENQHHNLDSSNKKVMTSRTGRQIRPPNRLTYDR